MGEIQYPWQRLLQDAIDETDPQKLPEKLAAAEGLSSDQAHALARGGQREGFDSPVHNAAQHGAQVTRHSTRHTTTCRSTTMRAGTGNSTLVTSRHQDNNQPIMQREPTRRTGRSGIVGPPVDAAPTGMIHQLALVACSPGISTVPISPAPSRRWKAPAP